MRRILRFFRILLAAALFVGLATPAFAQQSEIDALASKVVEKIGSKERKVFVEDFRLKQNGLHPLGEEIAEQFRAALRKAAPNMQIVNRETVVAVAEQKRVPTIDLFDSSILLPLSRSAGAEIGFVGSVEVKKKELHLEVTISKLNKNSFSVLGSETGGELGKFRTTLPMTTRFEELFALPGNGPINGVYVRGMQGVKNPDCEDCPDPSFSEAERAAKEPGSIVLRVTVTRDGRVGDIWVLKSWGRELYKQAIAAVQKWRFKPAQLPDGTPVSFRVTIEIAHNFR